MPSNPANGPRQMQTRWPTREKAHGLAGSCAAMIILIQAISASEMGRGFTRTRNREDTWNLDNGPPILIIEAAEHESREQAASPGIGLAHTLPARGCGATGPPPSHTRASRPGQTTGAVGSADWVATEDKASSSSLVAAMRYSCGPPACSPVP